MNKFKLIIFVIIIGSASNAQNYNIEILNKIQYEIFNGKSDGFYSKYIKEDSAIIQFSKIKSDSNTYIISRQITPSGDTIYFPGFYSKRKSNNGWISYMFKEIDILSLNVGGFKPLNLSCIQVLDSNFNPLKAIKFSHSGNMPISIMKFHRNKKMVNIDYAFYLNLMSEKIILKEKNIDAILAKYNFIPYFLFEFDIKYDIDLIYRISLIEVKGIIPCISEGQQIQNMKSADSQYDK